MTPWISHSLIFPLKTQMNRLFSKKSKKSPKLSQQHIFPGIVTNIAAGPLGFRAELDVDLKGEQGRSHRDLEADRADSLTMTLDGGPRTSQIVFHDKKSKDQALPAPGTSILGTVVGGEHGNDPSEFFPVIAANVHVDLCTSSRQKRTSTSLERKKENRRRRRRVRTATIMSFMDSDDQQKTKCKGRWMVLR